MGGVKNNSDSVIRQKKGQKNWFKTDLTAGVASWWQHEAFQWSQPNSARSQPASEASSVALCVWLNEETLSCQGHYRCLTPCTHPPVKHCDRKWPQTRAIQDKCAFFAIAHNCTAKWKRGREDGDEKRDCGWVECVRSGLIEAWGKVWVSGQQWSVDVQLLR